MSSEAFPSHTLEATAKLQNWYKWLASAQTVWGRVVSLQLSAMAVKNVLSLLLVLLTVPLCFGLPGSDIAERGSDVCHAGLYGIAVNLIHDYPPALQYCQSKSTTPLQL